MNALFWSLVPAAIGVFLVIAWLTDWTCRQIQAAYRRWACRREMARIRKEAVSRTGTQVAAAMRRIWCPACSVFVNREHDCPVRRHVLDVLATAQDKRERRIH